MPVPVSPTAKVAASIKAQQIPRRPPFQNSAMASTAKPGLNSGLPLKIGIKTSNTGLTTPRLNHWKRA